MKVCGHPGCPELDPTGWCPTHRRKPWAGSTRRATLPRGWSSRIVPAILRRDPICQICHAAPSTEVDHIGDRDDHRPTNLRGLCSPCHLTVTLGQAAEARRARRE